MKSNIFKTALILEGGGTRCSFTAGILDRFLENKIYFNYVTGVSAGSASLVNYLARSNWRLKATMVKLPTEKNFASWKSFLRGKGYFNSDYVYNRAAREGGDYPLDFETFMENPADFDIGCYNLTDNKLDYFSKKDVSTIEDLTEIIKASSALPIFMPQTSFRGKKYLDGGIYSGIALDAAIKRGYERFVYVPTRVEGYEKAPYKKSPLMFRAFKDYPKAFESVMKRHERYNETMRSLVDLQREGKAFILYPDYMDIKNRERNGRVLEKYFNQGREVFDKNKEDLYKFLNEAEESWR